MPALMTLALLGACHKRADSPSPEPSLSPLEAAGEAIYAEQGCPQCHTLDPRPYGVWIEPLDRGDPGKNGLGDIGPWYPAAWHYLHFKDPGLVVSLGPGESSPMPAYPQLLETPIQGWTRAMQPQADQIVASLAEQDLSSPADRQVIALIAYLQTLDTPAEAPPPPPPLDPNDPEVLTAGETLYAQNCAACHGPDLEGGIARSMVDGEWADGGTLPDIINSTREGTPAKGMPAWGPLLNEQQLFQVSAYVYAKAHATEAD